GAARAAAGRRPGRGRRSDGGGRARGRGASASGAGGDQMTWLRHALVIVGKDLRREARARDFAIATIVLALLVLLTFAFAFAVAGEHVRRAAPGILWATLLFAGVLVAGRTFAAEEERGTLEGLLLAPVDRGAIYLGKFLGMVITMGALEALVLPAYAAF